MRLYIRLPATQSQSTDKRRVPNDIDRIGIQANNNTLHGQVNAADGGVLNHDHPIAQIEDLTLQSE